MGVMGRKKWPEEKKEEKGREILLCRRDEARTFPSWEQRSILEGRSVLEKQLCWKVGDGSHIKIDSDPWLPIAYPFLLPLDISASLQSKNIFWVKDLMMSNRQCNLESNSTGSSP
ncbi:hypothetical protein PIB30_041666 [Stylosanthes scabra]|uniref:Uncharacterized protein n=1 Tax=Stylosanthes scabra TaxID=79078 RepID=A0ABU6RFL1_9FABA|nr:hypothetical protein [Stylosanthes scabra]